MSRTCQQCGKEFAVKPHKITEGKGLYCSRNCYYQHKGAEIPKIECECLNCGKIFYRRPSEIARGVSKYCSVKCSSIQKTGRKHTDATKETLSNKAKERLQNKPSPLKGHPRSEETKRKIAERLKGNKNGANWSDEKKANFHAKMSGKNNPIYGKKRSEEVRKRISEGHKGVQAREKHPNWKGGISFEPYCPAFTKELKVEIRERFDRRCFMCSISEGKERHSIHHIDYNKNDICNGKKWPLIPLCRKCHMKTNFNRWHWFNLLICYWAANPDINFGAA